MIRTWAMCAAALLALGCKTGEEPVRGAHRGVDPSGVYHPRPEPSTWGVETPILERRGPQFIVVGTTEEESERDLSAELRLAIGTPSDCVQDFVASTPTTIRISVTAIVRPTGMIIEPSAYGAGISKAARTCIERRVGTVVLRPLDESVSKTVSTVIEVNYEPEVIVESDPGVPEPTLKDVVQPLPKRPTLAPSGIPIQKPTSRAPEGGAETEKPIEGPAPKKISGPKPRPIDGYEVDENAQEWR